MTWLLLLGCVYLLGRACLAMERKVKDVLWAFGYPFYLTFQIGYGTLGALKWVGSKLLTKPRKPAYGDARFASEAQLKPHFRPGGYVVGTMRNRQLFTDPEACVLMLGKRGSGKSSTMGCTLARADGENFLVVDPPGALHSRFRGELEATGYRVLQINLKAPLEGDGYDPMAFFGKSSLYDLEGALDDMARLVAIDREPQAGSDSHFTEVAMNLIGGITAYLWKFHRTRASLHEVARILSGTTKTEMMQVLAEAEKSGDHYVKVAVNAYNRVEDRERGSIDSTLSRKTKKWLTPMYRDLCRPGWCWDEVLFAEKPVAVFVTGGMLDRDNIAPLMRIIVGQCIATLGRAFERNGRAPRDMKLLIDEADTLGRCKPVFSAITELRKAGVSCFLGYQSLAQLKQNFGEGDSTTIRDNCDMVFTGSLKDTGGYELARKLLGRQTVQSMQKSKAGVSESEAGHDLMGVDDMFKLGKGRHLVLLENQGVICDAPWSIRNGEVRYQ